MRTYKTTFLIAVAFVMFAMLPASASAQHRGSARGGVHVGIGIGIGFGAAYQYPWYPYPYNYPYPYRYPYGPYPYPPPYYYESTASLHIQVTPRQADVYVDGYHAGIVDDFDGVFQRLHVQPGGHEIVLFLEGYRTVEESVYLTPGQTQTIKLTMERLRSGETSGPRPVPRPPDEASQPYDRPGVRTPMAPGQPPPSGGVQAGPPQPMPGRGVPPQEQRMPMREGTLAIRVQPADAQIWIDGERWQAPQPRELRQIQLGEGQHKLELRKDGFDTFSAEVMVRPGQTTTVNVTLTKRD